MTNKGEINIINGQQISFARYKKKSIAVKKSTAVSRLASSEIWQNDAATSINKKIKQARAVRKAGLGVLPERGSFFLT